VRQRRFMFVSLAGGPTRRWSINTKLWLPGADLRKRHTPPLVTFSLRITTNESGLIAAAAPDTYYSFLPSVFKPIEWRHAYCEIA
jgi:hypothetical protein